VQFIVWAISKAELREEGISFSKRQEKAIFKNTVDKALGAVLQETGNHRIFHSGNSFR